MSSLDHGDRSTNTTTPRNNQVPPITTSLLSLESIPQITLTQVMDDSTMIPLSPPSDISSPSPPQFRSSIISNSSSNPQRRLRPKPPPPITTHRLSLPSSTPPAPPRVNNSPESPLPLTRDLLQRKNKLDTLTDYDKGLGITWLKHRRHHSGSSSSAGSVAAAGDCLSTSVSIHPHLPPPPQQSHHARSSSMGTNASSTTHHAPIPSFPFLGRSQGKYHLDPSMTRPSHRQQQHTTTTLLPPPPPYSLFPTLSERTLQWLYEAADRVVHARAPESKSMAAYDVDDLLLYTDGSAARPPDGLLLKGRALKYFSSTTPHSLRFRLWKHVVRSRNYELFMLMILLFHWVLLACHPIYTNEYKTTFHGHWHEYTLLLIQLIYTLDCFIKIVVYGLWISPHKNTRSTYQLLVQPWLKWLAFPWKNTATTTTPTSTTTATDDASLTSSHDHRAYLNSFGNVLDLMSVVCYWIDLGIMLYGYPYCSVFKALAAARPLRLLSVLPGTAVILKSLETGWDLMLDVAGFLFFFMLLFAMMGLISFRGVFSRQCYYTATDSLEPVLVTPPMYCSGYYTADGTIVGPFDTTLQTNTYPGYQGMLCPRGQQCIADPASLQNPYINYDMIFSAFLNVYTFVSMELWTDMMYATQDADSRLAALFYCLGVYVIGFILVFLLLAVITSAFARVRATSASSSAFTNRAMGGAGGAAATGQRARILQVLNDDNDDDDDDDDSDDDERTKGRRQRQRRQRRRRQLDRKRQHADPARRRLMAWKRRTVTCVQSKVFFYFGGAVVCLDTLFMCLRSVYASESMLEFLDNVETAFTFLFAIEIVVRMMGAVNWVRFWSSYRNKVDLFLVIVTCVIQLPMIQDSPVYRYLTVFQIFRMYRLFLCVPRLEKLLNAALGTGESVINVVIFLLLSTALFAPIFMQMFGGDFVEFIEPNDDRLRFDTFWQAFLALIMIYTSETWTDTLYDGMQSQLNGGAVYAGITICLYFAFARYIVAGLYVAVILENFELDDDYIRRYQIKHFIREKLARQKDELPTSYYQSLVRFMFGTKPSPPSTLKVSLLPMSLTAGLSKQDLADLLSLDRQETNTSTQDSDSDDDKEKSKGKAALWMPKKLSRFVGNVLFPDMDNVHISKLNQGITNGGGEEDYDLIVAEENRRAQAEDKGQTRVVKSLLLFSDSHPIRRFCKRLVGSCRDGRSERQNGFNWFIMACVLVSILVVILDEPSTRKLEQQQGDSTTDKTEIFAMIDMVMGVIFVVEMVLRVIADGLVLPQRAYLRHAWNRLDFVVILLNFGTLFADNNQLPRALGTVRSMRVLRLIRYFGGMRDVFIDLFHAFPLMMDAMLLTFLVMIPFSVYGVNIFGGRFWTCNDDNAAGRWDCMQEFVLNVGADDGYTLPILVPRIWQNPVMNLYSFDDFPVALRHLFSLTSTEGWVDSMFFAMSTPPDPDFMPVFDWQSPMIYHSIFYVAFMIISHGTVQLFVGVIIEKFKQRSGITTLTFAQRQYVDLQRQLAELKPTIKVFRPEGTQLSARIRAWCYDLVGGNQRNSLFNRWMMIVVVLNMGKSKEYLILSDFDLTVSDFVVWLGVIASEFNDEPTWLAQFQDYAYFAFAVLYVLEVLIKFLGLGRKKWWQGKWNIYDACIAVSSLALVIARFVAPELWSLRAERYCLVFAAFRMGEGVDALQTLYHTISMALPSIIRVSAVFMLVMCLFAMVFMEFFGLTKYGHTGSNNSNFRNYGNALLLLVRMTTGEGWNEVMMDYTFSAPNCVDSSNYLDSDCGSANWAYFLFNFFYITCTHIFLNLFIAVVISNFEYTYETRSRFTLITRSDLRKFKYAWAEVDPNGTGFIQKEHVAKFFKHLTGRFQISIYDPVYSLRSLQKLSQQKPGDAEKGLNPYDDGYAYYNYDSVNQCLSKMDAVALEQRRKRYNLVYMEIVDAQTSKGIAFSDVLHIMAFRFVDIEQALTLHPLMDRLEKLDQFNKTYAAEKARGVFLTLIQRKRYLRQLWQKRNQEELDAMVPVPTITIDNVPPPPPSPYAGQYLSSPSTPDMAFPSSPLLPLPPPGPQAQSPTTSSYSMHDFSSSTTTSPLGSPLPSPGPNAHPWVYLDPNASVSVDQAQRVMAALNDSPWSAMLYHE